ncbi:MAG: cysteine peptidase family C39 domain-containing protein [Spirochaetota bacterium]
MIPRTIKHSRAGTLLLAAALCCGYVWYLLAINRTDSEFHLVPEGRLQSSPESCGFAALAMYLSVQGVQVSEQRIIAHFSRDDWMTFAEMQEYVHLHGLRGRGLQIDPSLFLEHSMLSIVHLTEEHYVVYLTDLPGDNGLIFDPGVGYLRIPVNQLSKRMSGYVFYAHR